MGRRTTIEERELVINHFNSGYSQRKIAKMVNKSQGTVQHIIERFNKENRITNKSRKAPNKIFTEYDERWILREINKNPKLSAPKLKVEVQKTLGKQCCTETVRRVLRKGNLHGRTARNKPLIRSQNKKLRIEFAKKYINKDVAFWKSVIFADETKINCFASDGKLTVWRKPREELKLKNLKATVKHGGQHVMLWGCMSSTGVGEIHFIDGIMNQYYYLKILKQHLLSSAEKLGIQQNFKFYHDNDPKHSARTVREWLLYNCPTCLKTPPQSPDINVIENVWSMLKTKVAERNVSNKNELKTVVVEEWNSISPQYTQILVESMPKRLQAILDNKGGPTKY